MGYLDNTNDRASRIKRHLGSGTSEQASGEELRREEACSEDPKEAGITGSIADQFSAFCADKGVPTAGLLKSIGQVVDALGSEGKTEDAFFVARNAAQVYPCDFTRSLADKCFNLD